MKASTEMCSRKRIVLKQKCIYGKVLSKSVKGTCEVVY